MSVRISDLLHVTITVDPARLEELLDTLSSLPHHISAELIHGEWATDVQFPAYRIWLDDLHRILAGFEGARLRYLPIVDTLRAA